VDYWATQSIPYTIPQPISASLSPPVMTTTMRDADKRMTVGFQPQPLTSLSSPLVPPCPTACGTSRRPPATLVWPNMAINTKKHAKNEEKHQNSVSSETGTPSSKDLQTISDLTPLMTHCLRLASHHFLHRFRSKIVQNLKPMAKFSLSWIPPLQNLAKPLVYTLKTFWH